MENEVNMVSCPVCKGSKINPFGHCATDDTCKCCKGVGEITEALNITLARIRADVSKRFRQRFDKEIG